MVIADVMTAIYSRFLMFFEITFFESYCPCFAL